MNYDEMSDDEIDAMVTSVSLGFDMSEISEVSGNFHRGKPDDEDYRMSPILSFCRNPFHYMEIAIEHKISILLDDAMRYATNNPYECYEPHGLGESSGFFCEKIVGNQIGRAICIVYLKMMEAKRENN